MSVFVPSAPFGAEGSTPIDAQLAGRTLDAALECGASYADLYFEYAASASYQYEDQMLKKMTRNVDLGLGVRVLHGDATGYAYTEDLSEAAMLDAARTAAQIAKGEASHAPVGLKRLTLPSRYNLLEESISGDTKRKHALLVEADTTARALDSRVKRVDCSFSEEVREVLIANTLGVMASDRRPLMRFGVRVLVESKGKREFGSSGGGGRVGLEYFERHKPSAHAKRAVEQALTMLDAREAPAGELPVVLAPGDSGILIHEAVGHGMEADFIRKKTSNYTDLVGQEVASSLCTIVDNPTLDHSRGSINVDDEGSAPERVTLIEGGKLQGYLHDVQSERHFRNQLRGCRAGSGRRQGFRYSPLPRMTNTYLSAGDDAPEDIVRGVSRGVYAKSFGGGQVDISNGDFVFSLTEGYLIEDGKITAPVKGVNLIGNGPEVMRKISMLGSDFAHSDGIWTCGKDGQSVPVGVGCPTVKIASMTVGGTSMHGDASGGE